ncbi:hypothetical protein [Marinoscillum sp.]|uniref:hypothetical protein n=1 Tax=Marinoscillum sp. TaxID=2024838 RepID=UPI003BACA6C1
MRISRILPVIQEKLFRVVYEDNDENILEILQDQWTDTQWLRDFFITFKKDLDAIGEPFTIIGAVKQTINDADDLFLTLYKNNGDNLSDFFKPLDNRERVVTDNQSQKGRIKRPRTWLRLYAVHYDGKYIITGGAVKLTTGMNRPHLQKEIYKLELLRKRLKLDINTGTLGYLDL